MYASSVLLLPCPSCALGKPQYLHIGEEIDGVDMRAEVGLLTRNIVVMGEMEDRCYPYTNHICDFFDFDTFGGHIKVGMCLAKALSLTGGYSRFQLWTETHGRDRDGGAGGWKRSAPLGDVFFTNHGTFTWVTYQLLILRPWESADIL